MPSQLCHIFAGLDAARSLPAGWFDQFAAEAFFLGCQGPDVFYHNRRTKPGGFLYGTRLHRRGWGTFVAGFRERALSLGWGPDHPGMAYLAGMATHGHLDKWLHPFVVFHSGWKVPGQPTTEGLRHAHAFLERIFDALLWGRRTGQPVTECRWQDTFPSVSAFPSDFWTVWADALHEVFPQLSAREDVEPRLRNAVADTQGFLSYTAPSQTAHGVRAARHDALHYFHPIDLPDWDFFNETHGEWRDPVSGAVRRESFHDLYQGAVRESAAVLATIADPSVGWEPLLGNGSLNLPGLEGENQGPQFCRPWDFAQLYEREARARISAEVTPPKPRG